MATTVRLFEEVDLETLLAFEAPSKNARGLEYSCFTQNPQIRVQCARVEDGRKPRVRRLLSGREGSRGLLLELAAEQDLIVLKWGR